MTEGPVNAAVKWMIVAHQRLNEMDEPPTDYPFTDDFVGEDHRRDTLWPRTIGRAEYAAVTNEWWRIGDTQPHFEIEGIAVRGERCAAMRHTWELGDSGGEMIVCAQLDPTLMLVQRLAAFDADAADEAVALLDDWQAAPSR